MRKRDAEYIAAVSAVLAAEKMEHERFKERATYQARLLAQEIGRMFR